MSLRRQLARRLAEIEGRGPVAELSPRSRDGNEGWALAELIPAGQEWGGTYGACWVASYDLRREWPGSGSLLERLRPALSGSPCNGGRGWPETWRSPTVVALDVETCGFASVPVFLIGLVESDGERLLLRQGLARDYGEEAALLAWMATCLQRAGGLITFNGRSFDLPYLRDRQRYHRQRELDELPHLDLLPVARRIWKPDLPDCRLQTLERHLTKRTRIGDIAGRDIPDVYHTFVDTGNARHIRTVLRHNRLDLIMLLELFATAWHSLNATKDEP